MKIDPHSTNAVQNAVRPPTSSNKANKKTEAKSSVEKDNKETMRKRMSRWFAQVGISLDDPIASNQSIKEKLQHRRLIMEQRKLKNLQTILDLAMEFSLDGNSEENLDPDWFFSFAKMAEDIHSPAMQELWGKIFAVESSRPGSFSMSTLHTLTQISQREAKLFATAVNLASRSKGIHTPKLLVGFNQKPGLLSLFGWQKSHHINLAEFGIAYPDLLTLIDRGLIFASEIESAEFMRGNSSQWRCGDHSFSLTAKRNGIALHYYKFTNTGTELARLVASEKQERYIAKLCSELSHGFDLT